jgi:hypothetical protein
MSASLEASLRLEIAQYQAALAKAKGDAARFKDSIKKTGSGLGNDLFGKLKGQFGSLLPALAPAALVAGLHHVFGEMDDLADASVKLGTTPEVFQRIAAAAKILGGTDMDTVTSALIRLRRQLATDPAGDLAQGLKQAGIEARTFLALDADQQLIQLAGAFRRAQADGQALPLLNAAFGKSFSELIPLLASGGEEMQKYMSGAAVVSNAAVQAAADLNDQFDALIQKAETFGKQATVYIGTGLVDMFDLIFNHTGTLDDWLQKKVEADKQAAIARKEKEAAMKAARAAESTTTGTAKPEAKHKDDSATRQALHDANEIAAQREKIANARAEVNMIELQAQGRDKLVKKMQEEMAVAKRTKELKEMGMGSNAAAVLAQREFAAKEKLEKRTKNGGRTHIGGVGKSRMMQSGIDQFNRNQERVEQGIGESRWTGIGRGKSGFAHSAFDNAPLTSAQRSGRMMGGADAGALTDRARRNADNADAKGDNLTTLEGINKAQLDCLKILAG